MRGKFEQALLATNAEKWHIQGRIINASVSDFKRVMKQLCFSNITLALSEASPITFIMGFLFAWRQCTKLEINVQHYNF